MGQFDRIGEELKELAAEANDTSAAVLRSAALPKIHLGSLEAAVSKNQAGGRPGESKVWLRKGTNRPVTVGQIQAAVYDQHIDEIAQSLAVWSTTQL